MDFATVGYQRQFGSPVLDLEGKLIGLNFDNNWRRSAAGCSTRYKRAI